LLISGRWTNCEIITSERITIRNLRKKAERPWITKVNLVEGLFVVVNAIERGIVMAVISSFILVYRKRNKKIKSTQINGMIWWTDLKLQRKTK